MTDNINPCTPPAGTLCGTWHWLEIRGFKINKIAWKWTGSGWSYYGSAFYGGIPPQNMANIGWRYLGPVEEPPQVKGVDPQKLIDMGVVCQEQQVLLRDLLSQLNAARQKIADAALARGTVPESARTPQQRAPTKTQESTHE